VSGHVGGIPVIEGAAILLAGILIGVLAGRLLSHRGRREERPKGAMCECQHSIAYHDRQTGHCAGMRNVASKWNEFGDPVAWTEQPCTCRRYIGPEPLQEFYAPEILQQEPGATAEQ
jgi:hypothetical protein